MEKPPEDVVLLLYKVFAGDEWKVFDIYSNKQFMIDMVRQKLVKAWPTHEFGYLVYSKNSSVEKI